MATEIKTGAKGEMNLYHYFFESTSSYEDDSEDISLKAKDEKTIHLIQSKSHTDAFKSYRNKDTEKIYEIEVDKLIELIMQNGKKIK